MTIEQTLQDRQKTHGDWPEQARISQALKDTFRSSNGWNHLTPAMRDSLDMMAQKQARILSGDPNHEDHWVDLQGYSRLAEKSISSAVLEVELDGVVHTKTWNLPAS
jgi:hypothetical protein